MLCFFTACNENNPSLSKGRLFDSEQYFTEEASRLGSSATQVSKTSTQNGSRETKQVTIADWKKELQPFILCNINKASLQNSYTVDSSESNQQLFVSYTANEPALPVQKVAVTYSNKKISCITIETNYDNMLYTLSKKFTYLPDSSYTISGVQKIILNAPTAFSISASWN